MSIKQVLTRQKGRLAGFFLLLFAGCQPEPVMVPGALEFASAQRAIQAQMPMKATEHLAMAVRQGHPDAAAQWLALTQAEQGPLQQYQQLKQWQSAAPDPASAALLGLWQQPGIATPPIPIGPGAKHCAVQIQPVLTSALSITHWQRFQQDWPDSAFAALPICFLPAVLIDSRQLQCSEQVSRRIQCEAQALQHTVISGKAQLLLVAGGRGQASFNNGWLQLPENFSPALFRHEFSHALGFLDEYALSGPVAATECQRTDLTPNILFAEADLSRYAAYWQLPLSQIQLTPVATCQHANKQVFRPIAADSHMQHYELAVPAMYLQLMQRQLATPQRLMPVQYYFAALARQRQDMESWQQLMQHAAAFGYPAARDGLSAAGISLTAR